MFSVNFYLIDFYAEVATSVKYGSRVNGEIIITEIYSALVTNKVEFETNIHLLIFMCSI